MNNIRPETLAKLLKRRPSVPAVTIYTPLHRSSSPPHMTEDQVRLKNLVAEARRLLKGQQGGDVLIRSLEEYLEKLPADKSFWGNSCDGVVICADKKAITTLPLPMSTQEYVAVDNQFHLAPILGLLKDQQDYYVLVVAQHEPALFKGDMYGLSESDIKLPKSLHEGLNIDESGQKGEQSQSATGGTPGFNGRGGARDPKDADRLRFWRMIDKIIHDKVSDKLPMILAGTESETIEFRNVSKYPSLLKRAVHGGFGGVQPHDLFNAANKIIWQELVEVAHMSSADKYHEIAGRSSNLVASDKDMVSKAVQEGRVDTLLVATSRMTADTVQDSPEKTSQINFPEDKKVAKDFHQIVTDTWKQSGTIIGLEKDQMPVRGANLLAILRY